MPIGMKEETSSAWDTEKEGAICLTSNEIIPKLGCKGGRDRILKKWGKENNTERNYQKRQLANRDEMGAKLLE
jgi:hypothetical protein